MHSLIRNCNNTFYFLMQPSHLCTVSIAAWHLDLGRFFLYGFGVSSNIPEMHYQKYSLQVSFSKTLLIYVNANRDTILTEFVHISIRLQSHQNLPILRTLQTLIFISFSEICPISSWILSWVSVALCSGEWWVTGSTLLGMRQLRLWCSPLMLLHNYYYKYEYNWKTN